MMRICAPAAWSVAAGVQMRATQAACFAQLSQEPGSLQAVSHCWQHELSCANTFESVFGWPTDRYDVGHPMHFRV